MNTEFQASEWRACLMLFAKKFHGENFYQFCLAIEKIYLSQWVKAMRKDERYADYSSILTIIENSKKHDDVIQQVKAKVNLQDIVDAAMRPNIYNAGFGKYMLLRLEITAAEHDRPHQFTARSIEHVLPQNPDANGYWSNNHNLNDIKDYVNSIGNLVLLSKGKNSSASNSDFKDKKERYLKNKVSDYPRSIQVLKYDDWNRKVIEDRTTAAAASIIQDP